MKAKIAAGLLFFVVVGLGYAQGGIKDPVQDYLTFRDINRDPYLPDLERILILDLDVKNDGKPVRFISFNGYGGRQGNFWTAYIPEANGFQKADDSSKAIVFRPDAFFVGNIEEAGTYGLLAYHAGKGGGELSLYNIINGKVVNKEMGSLDLCNADDARKVEKYFNASSIQVKHPLTILDLENLRKLGYDVDGAKKKANEANHPLSASTAIIKEASNPTGNPVSVGSISVPHSEPVTPAAEKATLPIVYSLGIENKGISLWKVGGGFAFVIAAAAWLIRFTRKSRK